MSDDEEEESQQFFPIAVTTDMEKSASQEAWWIAHIREEVENKSVLAHICEMLSKHKCPVRDPYFPQTPTYRVLLQHIRLVHENVISGDKEAKINQVFHRLVFGSIRKDRPAIEGACILLRLAIFHDADIISGYVDDVRKNLDRSTLISLGESIQYYLTTTAADKYKASKKEVDERVSYLAQVIKLYHGVTWFRSPPITQTQAYNILMDQPVGLRLKTKIKFNIIKYWRRIAVITDAHSANIASRLRYDDLKLRKDAEAIVEREYEIYNRSVAMLQQLCVFEANCDVEKLYYNQQLRRHTGETARKRNTSLYTIGKEFGLMDAAIIRLIGIYEFDKYDKLETFQSKERRITMRVKEWIARGSIAYYGNDMPKWMVNAMTKS